MPTSSRKQALLVAVLVCVVILGFVLLNPIRRIARDVGSGDIAGALEFGGLQRTYLIHVPHSYDGTRFVPLLLAFHGGDGTGQGMERLTHLDDVSERSGFIVVYPDGFKNEWADGRGATAADQAHVDDVGFVSKLIDTLSIQYHVDPNRVYALGMSNGGFFTDRLACELSGKFAAVAVVAATMSPDTSNKCNPMRPISVLMIQGDADPLVPVNGGFVRGPLGGKRGYVLSLNETIDQWLQVDGCASHSDSNRLPDVAGDGTQITQESYRSCRDGTEVIVYRVGGGGHAWPGGLPYLPEYVIGKTSRNMDASQVIWTFFEANVKP